MNAMGKSSVNLAREENGKRGNNCEAEEVDPDSLADDLEDEEGAKLDHRETDAEVENEVADVFANDEVRSLHIWHKKFYSNSELFCTKFKKKLLTPSNIILIA